jgi:hypothetical protein
VRSLAAGLLSMLAFGLLLVCLGGLSGCGSRPADGQVVPDGAIASAEQKSKVDSYYTDRKKNATKNRQPSRRR